MDLEPIRRRLSQASGGPWVRHGCDVYAGDALIFQGRDGSPEIRQQADRDSEFVAHAREDLAALLSVIDQAGLESEIADRPSPPSTDVQEAPRRGPRHAAS